MYKGYKVTITDKTYKQTDEWTNQHVNMQEVSFDPDRGAPPEAQGSVQSPRSGKGAVGAVVVNQAKNAITYGVSNYGNLTGDYVTQANINAIIEIGGLIGMAATGSVGAIAATGSVALKVADYYLDQSRMRREVDFLRQRVGMIDGRSR